MRPAGVFVSPMWIRPRRNVPVVMTTASSLDRPARDDNSADSPAFDEQVLGLALDDLEIGGVADGSLHGLPIQLSVGLSARALNRRPLGAVQQPELNAGGIGHSAHQAVQGIDLADEMAFSEPSDGRVAGHLADCSKGMSDQRRARAHARGRGRRLAAGVTAAYHHDIEGQFSHGRAYSALPDAA